MARYATNITQEICEDQLRSETKSGDERYDSVNVTRLINYIMIRGQKETARQIVYAAFEEIKNAKEGGGTQ